MIFDIRYSNMSTNRVNGPTNVERVRLDSRFYAEVLNEDEEQRLGYISEQPGYTIKEDTSILEQLEAKNPTEELTIHAVGSGESYVLEVRRDNVVGRLAMDIHKRWGVTPAEQRLFHEGLLLPHDMPLRYLDNGATVQMRSPVVIKMTSDTFDDYEIKVLPGDNVESVMYDVQRRWGVGSSE